MGRMSLLPRVDPEALCALSTQPVVQQTAARQLLLMPRCCAGRLSMLHACGQNRVIRSACTSGFSLASVSRPADGFATC